MSSTFAIGAGAITLYLPGCHSLKEKRQIIQSLLARIRNHFSVAIAEVEEQDRWQIAKLGVTYVSNNGQHAGEVVEHVRRYIEETRPDIFVTDFQSEILHW
ncbi:DUF503 domain-containing protein [Ktedonospora formicarum]|uniref:DUF503 domain-containing protein n=1 Tax=Ktedonospora formicarum TaxID=2778364 RepID=A0A8J3HYV6_9CHLR|nr:DUF503 domain-containing protein [Ktedonospora formicarum]GHO43650.1 hypothetical protein KSX_18130 [Ktedonospora formicarum]